MPSVAGPAEFSQAKVKLLSPRRTNWYRIVIAPPGIPGGLPNPVVRVSICPATGGLLGINDVPVGNIGGYVTTGGGAVIERPA
jgi:hypothetical protein